MIILDGGLGQELVKRAGKATDLWSMQALLDNPDMVRAVHDDYFAAGAQIATYQYLFGSARPAGEQRLGG
jgi:S-methylmethionine-dependent homocysteine/selenocysteine methylase